MMCCRRRERGEDFALQATAAAFAWDDSLRDQLSVEFDMPVSRVVQRYKDFEMMQSLPVLPKVQAPCRMWLADARTPAPSVDGG